MAKAESGIISPRASQILAILWEFGSSTAEQIRESLPDDLHDSTVRTLLRQLEEKGLVTHEERRRQFVYSAAIEQSKVQSSVLHGVIKRFFGGSAEALVQKLLSEKHLTREQLDLLRKDAIRPGGAKRKGGKR